MTCFSYPPTAWSHMLCRVNFPHAFCEIWHRSWLSCNLLSFLLVAKNVICHSLKCPNIYSSQNSFFGGFPGGPVDRNPPANAGDMGLIPDPGRFHTPQATKASVPQMLEPACSRACEPKLMTPCVTATEPCVPMLYNKKPTMRSLCTATKSTPHSLQLQKACVQQQRPRATKILFSCAWNL